MKKLLKSKYSKDIVLYNLHKEYIKNRGKKKTLKLKKLSLILPLFKEDLQLKRGDMLHIIDSPMQLVHADVADLNIFSKTAVAPKYCLLCVDMFTSKTYPKKEPVGRQTRKIFIGNPGAQEIFNQRR